MEDLGKYIVENTKVEFALNEDENKPPFGYFHPELEGNLIWICGEDAEGRLTSVFCFQQDGQKDKKSDYLTLEQALHTKRELVNAGWKKMAAPKVTFTTSDDQPVALNRSQRRRLERQLKKTKNPFDGK